MVAPSIDAAGGRWRTVVSAVCIVIASILVPVSIVGGWTRMQLVDEDAFVETLSPLIDEVEVQELITDETMSAIRARIDFVELTDEIFDGIGELGVPPRASAALDLLRHPAAEGLAGIVESTVSSAIASDVFSDVWATSLRGAHRVFSLASTSDGGGIIVLDHGDLAIATGHLVEAIKEQLVERGIAVGALIPTVNRTIVLGDGEALIAIHATHAIVKTMGQWLPVITIGLFGFGIAVARRRSSALLGAGIGAGLGSGALGFILTLGSAAVAAVTGGTGLSPAGLDVIYSHLTAAMMRSSSTFAMLGIIAALIGWLCGRTTAARRVKSATASVNSSVRGYLVTRGWNSPTLGSWLARHRVIIRVVIVLLAVLWVFALTQLEPRSMLLVLVATLVALWSLEILHAPTDDRQDAAMAPGREAVR